MSLALSAFTSRSSSLVGKQLIGTLAPFTRSVWDPTRTITPLIFIDSGILNDGEQLGGVVRMLI